MTTAPDPRLAATVPALAPPADEAVPAQPIFVDEPDAAVDTSPVVLPAPRRRTRLRIAVAFLVGLIAATALGAGALYAYDRHYAGLVLPGVHVGAVDLSGLAPDAAKARLAEAYSSFGQGTVVLTGGFSQAGIDFSDIARRPDVDAMVEEAMRVGRGGNALEQAIADARTAIHGVQLQPRVTFDPVALAAAVEAHAATLDRRPIDAVAVNAPEGFGIRAGIHGQRADREGPTAKLAAALATVDAADRIEVEMGLTLVEPTITTEEATSATEAATRIATDLNLVEGEEKWTLTAAGLRSWITFEPSIGGSIEPRIDRALLDASLLRLAAKIDLKPVNASFKVSGTKVVGVTAGKNGRTLDTAATSSLVAEALAARAAGATDLELKPALTVTHPALTTEEAEKAAPLMRRVSTWTTYFPIGEKNGFGNNIWIPALDIDGYLVGPRETFDFWNAVGPISRERGYRDGGAIINGRTEPQGALAGGICSCSTTLFNAALRAGYEMGARRNHYYYIDRYPLGLDATVFKSGSGSVQTMSWTNDTDYPVLIRGFKIKDGSRGYVRFDLYSVPTGRKVSFSTPIVKNIRPASDSVQYTSSLAPGARKRIEYPVTGKDVWVTRTVRDAKGNVIHTDRYYSHYARITGIVLVGRGSASDTTSKPAPTATPAPS